MLRRAINDPLQGFSSRFGGEHSEQDVGEKPEHLIDGHGFGCWVGLRRRRGRRSVSGTEVDSFGGALDVFRTSRTGTVGGDMAGLFTVGAGRDWRGRAGRSGGMGGGAGVAESWFSAGRGGVSKSQTARALQRLGSGDMRGFARVYSVEHRYTFRKKAIEGAGIGGDYPEHGGGFIGGPGDDAPGAQDGDAAGRQGCHDIFGGDRGVCVAEDAAKGGSRGGIGAGLAGGR